MAHTARRQRGQRRPASAAVSPDSTTLRGPLTAATTEPIAEGRSASVGGLRGRQADRGHAAAAGGLLHGASALPHHTHRIGQAQHAGHMQRRDLADAVADDAVGPQAPRLPQRGQGHLQRKQRRLRDLGVRRAAIRASSAVSSSSSDQPAKRARATRRIGVIDRRERPARWPAARGPCRTTADLGRRRRKRRGARHRPAGLRAAIAVALQQLVRGAPASRRGSTPTTAARRSADGCGAARPCRRRPPRGRWCVPRKSRPVPASGPAAPVGALRRQRQQRALIGGGVIGRRPGRRGASSRITWALVPPTPNELTPAHTRLRRRRPRRQRGRDRRAACRRARCAG